MSFSRQVQEDVSVFEVGGAGCCGCVDCVHAVAWNIGENGVQN